MLGSETLQLNPEATSTLSFQAFAILWELPATEPVSPRLA